MVYNWDDKEAECYRLYVEEKKSLDEVIAHWDARGFTPSKRAFQTQFKRWDFPSKQNPAHRNPALVARLRELWEENYSQRDMVDTLQNEGYSINDRELIRLRLRLKLLLRESAPRPKRKRSADSGVKKTSRKKTPKIVPGRGLINQLGNAILAEESSSEESDDEPQAEEQDVREPTQVADGTNRQNDLQEEDVTPLSAEDMMRKQLRLEQLQNESDEKWRTRKRRRRTRGWAGLPADAPGEPPRFPSETTIDEAKAYLGLDNDMYRQVRERFLQICKDHHVIKKTIAGPQKWAEIVRQLIDENEHLTSVFQQEPDVLSSIDALFRPKGQRALSLDVICMDVTKRLRTMDSRMTLADVKNILCLNPEKTRHVRSEFAAKLKADHFTNKHEAGEQHWADLKTAWVNESDLLRAALAGGEADPEHQQKLRAIEVLARDIMKRQQQEKTIKDPSKKKQVHQGPGPGPAKPVMPTRSRSQPTDAQPTSQTTYDSMTALGSAADLQIDPSLLLAASDASILPTPTYQYQYQDQDQRSAQNTYDQTYFPASHSSLPLPIYFRLHPHSSTPLPSKTVWLSILHHVSVAEIRQLAAREHPGCAVLKLEGLVMYRREGGEREVLVDVGDDEELGAYLGHVQSAGEGRARGKATFVVLLGSGGFV
ncbi:hypothetical protein HBH53_212790 [Parastagonospora nodorum]|nr:hypothetical protein HBH53_212790 [Parastagonospora nodorum]KAH4600405.1 hypothetical protein HBH82_190960 [Parastagonospora nodorum]KAH4672697.1 hypothetical protein HBH78_173730 [Parastagonospora nodorum]KAH4697002.1 hypothetical protein HBH67_184740 [Parastagonospora nodorum]KAH4765293.1 hypothetical protein HBH63_181570 [Parastagonospora nodorum]